MIIMIAFKCIIVIWICNKNRLNYANSLFSCAKSQKSPVSLRGKNEFNNDKYCKYAAATDVFNRLINGPIRRLSTLHL